MKEVLKLVAAGLAAAAIQVVNLVTTGGALSGAVVVKILIGTVLVRIASWVVAKYGPAPAP